jgi:hypothetical protein
LGGASGKDLSFSLANGEKDICHLFVLGLSFEERVGLLDV